MKTLFGLGAGTVRAEGKAGRTVESIVGAGAVVAVFAAASIAGAQTATVPKAYADLYQQLEAKLQKTSERIDRQWDKSKAPVDFSAEMVTANSNRGVQLLQPVTLWGVRLEMQRLQELGVKAVTLSINFPVLYEPFHQFNGTTYRAFLDFYKHVVKGAHWKKFAYLSPFWTRMLYGGYVDYDEARRVERGPQGAARLFALSNRQAAEGLRAGRFSPTGAAYGRMIQGNFAGTK